MKTQKNIFGGGRLI